MPGIFVSYRQADTSATATILYDRLVERFGRDAVFRDSKTLIPGQEYKKTIQESIIQATIFLELIGPQWLDITDEQGRRRLDNPEDIVRIEIETALDHKIPIIPVFVNLTTPPPPARLPGAIARLPEFHGVFLHQDAFDDGLNQLIQAMNTWIREEGFQERVYQGTKYIVQQTMVIPGGLFIMGNDQGAENERPQHQFSLPDFRLARCAVTVLEYQRFLAAAQHPAPSNNGIYWSEQMLTPYAPIVNLTWLDAVAYAVWLRRISGQAWRLPTEAEWEKAARSTDGRLYPWGNEFADSRCVTSQRHLAGPLPVSRAAAKPGASEQGVLDLAGNVWEWTASLSVPYPYQPGGNREDATNPGNRIKRGGSWHDGPEDARTTRRLPADPRLANAYTGFRLALG